MNDTTTPKVETKVNSPYQYQSPSTARRRGLAASWFKVEGRLVCKWFPVEN
ncbi:hypothetical protein K9N68_25815 [Kovacikia minuta CCNUW1]|uniref:hypothetical protein n=1 Tax=Kovacikia minuta TaxID=2931930 RepID=UPI001CCE25E2|nr:hypothetical protein [Kovacikia minuta]UBF25025.1 hypothetical protein K9N68_25815 [Kovacikia minuta CCNUW1]